MEKERRPHRDTDRPGELLSRLEGEKRILIKRRRKGHVNYCTRRNVSTSGNDKKIEGRKNTGLEEENKDRRKRKS